MIKVLAIDHVVLRTVRLEAMLNFYGQVLGCKIERELPELGLVQLRAGISLIDLVPVESELGRLGGKPPSQDGRNMEHLCLQLESVDEQLLHDYLASHGIEADEFAERYGADGYGQSIYINDPEGNVIELKLACSAA